MNGETPAQPADGALRDELRETLRLLTIFVTAWRETAESIDDHSGVTACAEIALHYRNRAMEMEGVIAGIVRALAAQPVSDSSLPPFLPPRRGGDHDLA